MLSKFFNLDNIKIISKDDFNFYPQASDREAWEGLSSELKEKLVAEGERYLNYTYPFLPMTLYLEYKRSGARPPYEDLFHQRRTAIKSLMLAECVEYKGRFIEDLINGIYCICDETSWVVPAHNYSDLKYGKNMVELPVDDNQVIDLWSSSTAYYLSLIYLCLHNELDAVSPLICSRIENIIEKRQISLYEKHDEYFWKRDTNNWNTNCNYASLMTGMIMIEDEQRRKRYLEKILKSVNIFINSYNNDGGCNEGPGYWSGACGTFYKIVEILKYISFSKIDLFTEQKLINMANFPAKMYIGNERFANFSDSRSKVKLSYSLLYNFGKAVGNHSLMALSKVAKKISPVCDDIENVFAYDKVEKVESEVIHDREYFYPDLQVLILREQNENSEMFFAVKGGHNDESHNHNDIGNFMIYKNQKPVVIDVGTGQYTKDTFTPRRYTIWFTNSFHHNVPVIDGEGQKNGREFCASELNYENDRFTLDISKAYESDNVKVWKRVFGFNREEFKIEVAESFELDKESDIRLTFMLPSEPKIQKDYIELSEGVKLCFEDLMAEYEEITDIDNVVKSQWDKIYKLSLITTKKKGEIKYCFDMGVIN